nr:unnamed protein product [Callosobruchus chinensis]
MQIFGNYCPSHQASCNRW